MPPCKCLHMNASILHRATNTKLVRSVSFRHAKGERRQVQRDVLRDRGVGCALLLRVLVPAGLGRRQRTDGVPLLPGTLYKLLDIWKIDSDH